MGRLVMTEVSPDAIREALAEEHPLVLIVPPPEADTTRFAHAVVVCGVSSDAVRVMDPSVGDYRDLPLSRLEQMVARDEVSGFFVGRLAGDAEDSPEQCAIAGDDAHS